MNTIIFCSVVVVLFLSVVYGEAVIPPNHPYIKYSGRTSFENGSALFDWPGVAISFYITGQVCGISLSSPPLPLAAANYGNEDIFVGATSGAGEGMLNVFIDGALSQVLTVGDTATTYNLTTVPGNDVHHYLITKRTEPLVGIILFSGLILDSTDSIIDKNTNSQRKIEWIGDSITCGYGIMGTSPCGFTPETENNWLTYESLVSQWLGAEMYVEAWSGKGVVRNCCNQNITTPDPLPTYYERSVANTNASDWDFTKWTPNAIVINLGTNDYSSQPAPPQDIFTNGYNDFIATIRAKYAPATPTIFLACGPMIGKPCCSYVEEIAQANNVNYIDMMGILGPKDYGCAGHPDVTGHAKMANVTGPIISKIMGWPYTQ